MVKGPWFASAKRKYKPHIIPAALCMNFLCGGIKGTPAEMISYLNDVRITQGYK